MAYKILQLKRKYTLPLRQLHILSAIIGKLDNIKAFNYGTMITVKYYIYFIIGEAAKKKFQKMARPLRGGGGGEKGGP